ncbi:hypothetical protein Ahy_A05g022983 isoform A [Arachis hypogaea]|uniref:Uncharacterized protein n=1 Tax=Arachis hypogaea TaxID=3818 RepID=A0A445D241_ARAHY|nr:hypothetical protein Ahy_A05g022983 isoform A [Arachis hypogaea]
MFINSSIFLLYLKLSVVHTLDYPLLIYNQTVHNRDKPQSGTIMRLECNFKDHFEAYLVHNITIFYNCTYFYPDNHSLGCGDVVYYNGTEKEGLASHQGYDKTLKTGQDRNIKFCVLGHTAPKSDFLRIILSVAIEERVLALLVVKTSFVFLLYIYENFDIYLLEVLIYQVYMHNCIKQKVTELYDNHLEYPIAYLHIPEAWDRTQNQFLMITYPLAFGVVDLLPTVEAGDGGGGSSFSNTASSAVDEISMTSAWLWPLYSPSLCISLRVSTTSCIEGLISLELCKH